MVQARHRKIEINVDGEEISKRSSIAVGGSGGNGVSVFRFGGGVCTFVDMIVVGIGGGVNTVPPYLSVRFES